MRIATAALNQTPLDWNRNADNIRCALEWTRKQETMVVCLPELCLSGAGCGPHFRRRPVLDKSLDMLFKLLDELKGMIVTLGLPLEFEGNIFNAACLVVDGKPFGFQCKTNFRPANLQELGWFRPWPRNQHAVIELNGQAYKIGDLSFDFNLNPEMTGGKSFHVAVEIGEPDWETPWTPVAAADRRKLDLLLNPAASPFALEKHAKRLRYAEKATEEFSYIHAFSNDVGNESGAVIYDGGSFIAERGKIVAMTPRFSYHDAQVAVATLGKDGPAAEPDHFDRNEELARAVPLGMLDYLRKSGAKGFALSLSGGADSGSLVAFASLGIQFALDELGLHGFHSQFGFVPDLAAAQTPKDMLGKLLACFYQSTRNSGETTRTAAKSLAENLGAAFYEWDVDPLVEQYTAMVSAALGRKLDWETDDIALQNIQARVRVPGAWLYANAHAAILLATGNRSEATLGYTTMDGDTCGALAPIGGVDKAFLRQWLVWLEKTGPQIGGERQPMPFLSAINVQAPTAELRPRVSGQTQTDEKDMMPYPVLNRIEQLGIVQGKTATEIRETLHTEFPEHDVACLTVWIDRFFALWHRNQWKRNRYAMSFHLDDTTLRGEQWRAFPALSGGNH